MNNNMDNDMNNDNIQYINDDQNHDDYDDCDDNDKIYDENGIDLLNIFLCYYRQLFQKNCVNMFTGIDYDKGGSTNRCMELLYEHVQKYKEAEKSNNIEKIELFNVEDLDIDKCEELYQLNIDNKPKKISQLLLPIMLYLTTIDWTTINWSIVPIKTNH